MITLARIFEAWMNAEQFDFPIADRSFLWHLFKIPHYAFAIFSLWTYGILGEILHSNFPVINRKLVTFGILAVDVILAWPVFEFSLEYFRR